MNEEYLYEITIYTENQVGLLSSIAGIFTRRSLNIEKMLAYPSKIPGIHKMRLYTRATPERIKEVNLQIEKRVEVVRSFYEIDSERSDREVKEIKAFLEEHENENKQQ